MAAHSEPTRRFDNPRLFGVRQNQTSNERALLAYYTTGLTALVSGVTGFNVFHDIVLRSTGMMLIIFGVGIMLIGIVRYHRFRRRIEVLGGTDYTTGKP